MAGGFQGGGGSEGWVVDASACPGVFFRPAAVWRGWLRGRQAQFRLQNNLAVGGWGVRNGCYDPLFGSDGGQFRGPLMLRGGLVLWLSAVAEDVLSQATDAQERYENQEDDDKDPEGAREEPKGLPLVFWAACVTTTLQSFRAGVEGSTRGCSLWKKRGRGVGHTLGGARGGGFHPDATQARPAGPQRTRIGPQACPPPDSSCSPGQWLEPQLLPLLTAPPTAPAHPQVQKLAPSPQPSNPTPSRAGCQRSPLTCHL